MPTDQPIQLTFAQLFDTLSDAVVYFKAIHDEHRQLVDFVVDYMNPSAKLYAEGRYQTTVGASVRHNTHQDPILAERTFASLQAIVETGLSTEQEHFSPTLNEWILLNWTRAGDGVLSISRIVTARKQTEAELKRQTDRLNEQNVLLQSILDTSLNNVFVYEAIRDLLPDGQPGPIRDFAIRLVNEQARRDTLLWMGADPTGNTLLNAHPSSQTSGQFNLFCQVTETGQSVQREHYYPAAQVWFNTSITKLNDGCVVTGINITDQKQATLANKHQTELLNNVLNTSSSGIKALEAIRDRQGNIDDFTILVINEAGAAIRGEAISDLVGKRASAVFPELRETGLHARYSAVTQTGQSQRVQAYYGGAWYDMAIVPFGDGVVITYTDISESRQAKLTIELAAAQNLRQAELLNGVLDGSANGILAIESLRDADGSLIDFTLLAVNDAASRMFGRSTGDLIGQRALTVYPGLVESGMLTKYTRTVETGEPFVVEVQYQFDGLDSWYEVSGQKFGDGLVVTFRDVLQTKQLQQAIERHATENQQQAELINSVLDSSNSGIMAFEAIRDPDQRIIDFHFLSANQASIALIGRTMAEMTGNRLLALFPGNRESGLFDLYVHTTETGQPGRTELYYNHDGLDFWIDVSAQKLGDGFVVTFTDVSVVKRAARAVELAAAASERQAELLNTVLDNSQTAISLHEAIRDPVGRIADFRVVLANSRAMAMWGPLAEAIMSRTFFDVASPEQQALDFGKYVNVVETGEPDLSEFSIGEQRWLRLTAKSGDGIVISNIDITQSHQLQQRLEASATELQTIIDTSQTGIFLFSPVRDRSEADREPHQEEIKDFRIRLANRMLAAYVGQQPDAVVGALGSTWFPGYKTNGLFEAFHKTYVTGETQRFDFHYDTDSIDAWLDIMSTKLGDEVLVTFGDYTPLKKLQQRLEATVVDLQRSNANLEQFAYVASHDLQEPLRKIQAFGDIIRSQYAPVIGDQGADMIQRMQSAAARMQMLIKDVLAYSRVATRRENLGPVDLNTVVKGVLEDLETAITDRDAIVTIGSLPTVTGDVPQLRQLMQNLLSNSLKFVKPGTTPHITMKSHVVRGSDPGIPVLKADANRLFHLIELRDNGIGFDPQYADRIFQVFQRLHNRNSYEGTGIGLAIVHKVVENHQGYIAAHSQPGEGATFRLLLPVAD